jgi:ribonuclease BN (tRNA processing enzyme)
MLIKGDYMKITFLGTGSIGSEKSANTSLLINDNILLDIGSGTIAEMRRNNIKTSDIKYLIITNYETDHFLDIAYLLFRRILKNDITNKLIIIGPHLIREKTIELLTFTQTDGNNLKFKDISERYNIDFIELNNDSYSDEILKVSSIQMIHGQFNFCNGYIIDIDNIKIGYTGDTTMCSNLHSICGGANHIIIDANEIETTMAHVGLSDVLRLSNEYPNSTFYAVHRSDYEFSDTTDKVKFPKDGEAIEIKE